MIAFDIKYGGEPEPEVKWFKGEEVIRQMFFTSYYFHNHFNTSFEIKVPRKMTKNINPDPQGHKSSLFLLRYFDIVWRLPQGTILGPVIETISIHKILIKLSLLSLNWI